MTLLINELISLLEKDNSKLRNNNSNNKENKENLLYDKLVSLVSKNIEDFITSTESKEDILLRGLNDLKKTREEQDIIASNVQYNNNNNSSGVIIKESNNTTPPPPPKDENITSNISNKTDEKLQNDNPIKPEDTDSKDLMDKFKWVLIGFGILMFLLFIIFGVYYYYSYNNDIPNQPVQPVEPINYVQPSQPVQPINYIQPVQPVNYIRPVNKVHYEENIIPEPSLFMSMFNPPVNQKSLRPRESSIDTTRDNINLEKKYTEEFKHSQETREPKIEKSVIPFFSNQKKEENPEYDNKINQEELKKLQETKVSEVPEVTKVTKVPKEENSIFSFFSNQKKEENPEYDNKINQEELKKLQETKVTKVTKVPSEEKSVIPFFSNQNKNDDYKSIIEEDFKRTNSAISLDSTKSTDTDSTKSTNSSNSSKSTNSSKSSNDNKANNTKKETELYNVSYSLNKKESPVIKGGRKKKK